jgi:hypothetical protein
MLLFAVEPLSVKMMRETLNLFSTNRDSAINLKTVLKIFFVPRRIAVQIHPWIVLIEIPDPNEIRVQHQGQINASATGGATTRHRRNPLLREGKKEWYFNKWLQYLNCYLFSGTFIVKRSDIFHLCCLVATESQTEKACFNP